MEKPDELKKQNQRAANHKNGRRAGGKWRYSALLSLFLSATSPVIASTSVEILRTKAQLAYSSQQYSEALSLLEVALQKDSRDLLSLYYRGLTHARLREYEPALADLKQVMGAGADYPSLPYELGMVAFHKEDYVQAVSALERALNAQPQRRVVAYYLGVSHYRLGEYEAALRPLRQSALQGGDMQVASLYLQAEALYHLGRREVGRAVLKGLMGVEKSSRLFDHHLYPFSSLWRSSEAEEARYRALFSAAGMDMETAGHLFDESVAADPEDAHARYYRGVLASRQGDFATARDDLRRAEEGGIIHRELHHEVGYVAYRQGDYAAAVKQLRQGLNEEPGHNRSRYYIGRSLQRQGSYEAALAELKQVSDEGELGVAADYARADILATLHRYDEARDILQQILSDHGQSPYAERARRLNEKLAARRGIFTELEAQFSAGMVHDSNVALYSDDLPLPTTLSDRADSRWQLGLQLKWMPLPTSSIPVSLGYHLFQSRHQTLSDYDLRSHALRADWKKELAQGEWGMGYRYVKASLDNYDYVDSHQLTPYLMVPHGEQRLSFAKLEWSNNRYSYPSMGGYDGNRFNLNYRHFWLQGDKRYLAAGADLGSERTEDENLNSIKYGLNGSAQWDWQKILASLNLQYLKREFPDALIDRSDSVVKAGLRLRYPVTQRTEFETTVNYINNASSRSAYDYGRTVYGVTLKWKL